MAIKKIRKHLKKIIIGLSIVLIGLFVRHLYGIFIQPFIDPYFFRIGNIEKIVGMRLPVHRSGFVLLLQYEITTEPSYRFAGTKGIKEIFAALQIDERTFEALKARQRPNPRDTRNLAWHTWNRFQCKETYVQNYMVTERNREYFDFGDFEDFRIIYYQTYLWQQVYHGIFSIRQSPWPVTSVFIVITKIDAGDDLYFYYLYVFNR